MRVPREDVLERLSTETYDLLVVGAGIVGARIACEAARCGLRTALVDGGDFGSGTSSASTKLVHGGLRYLATGQLQLVRKAQHERCVLETVVAPGLVQPMPMVLAATERGTGRALLPAAVALYRALAGGGVHRPRLIGVDTAALLVPPLRREVVTSAAVVHEARTNDARLTLATVGAAAAAGADVANYLRVLALAQVRGRVAGATVQGPPGEGTIAIRARAVVNATGPWVDHVRRLEHPGAAPLVRLSKGVNVFLRHDDEWPGALALFDRTRSVVAVPWHGLLVVGATDTPFDEHPGAVRPGPADVDQILTSLQHVLPAELLAHDRVLSVTAGLRALERGNGSTAGAARDEVVHVGPAGVVSVAGGKLTTHRLIAISALSALPAEVRPRSLRASSRPLVPGCVSLDAPPIDVATATYLLSLYGGATADVIDRGELEPVAPGGPDVRAQLAYARDAEWALSVDDIVRRRTTLELRGLATPAVRASIADELALPQSVTTVAARPAVDRTRALAGVRG